MRTMGSEMQLNEGETVMIQKSQPRTDTGYVQGEMDEWIVEGYIVSDEVMV